MCRQDIGKKKKKPDVAAAVTDVQSHPLWAEQKNRQGAVAQISWSK